MLFIFTLFHVIYAVMCKNTDVNAFDEAQLVCHVKGISPNENITLSWNRDVTVIADDTNHKVTVTDRSRKTVLTVRVVGRSVIQFIVFYFT